MEFFNCRHRVNSSTDFSSFPPHLAWDCSTAAAGVGTLQSLQANDAAVLQPVRGCTIKLVPASHYYYLMEPDTQDPGHWLLAPGDTEQGAGWRFRSGDRGGGVGVSSDNLIYIIFIA